MSRWPNPIVDEPNATTTVPASTSRGSATRRRSSRFTTTTASATVTALRRTAAPGVPSGVTFATAAISPGHSGGQIVSGRSR